MEFTDQIRLDRHVNKAHAKKSDSTNHDRLWYEAGAASGYI